MRVVALYVSLLDGNYEKKFVKNPPSTQEAISRFDGKGMAIEMLNRLKSTDVNQLPALKLSTKTMFVGKIPEAFQWSDR